MKIARRLWVLFISTLVLFGCQSDNPPTSSKRSAPPDDQIPQTVRVRQTAPSPKKEKTSQEIANRLVNIALQFPQVKNASAISVGEYSLVGIDVDPSLDRGQVGTLKASVAEALQEDPQGANALVTADPNLTERIRKLSQEIAEGHVLSGLAEEVAEIASRIAPHPARQVEKNEKPNP